MPATHAKSCSYRIFRGRKLVLIFFKDAQSAKDYFSQNFPF